MKNLGQNRGYIDELYAAYKADSSSVSRAWREFFADYRPDSSAVAPTAAARPAPRKPAVESGRSEPLRGVAARIVDNMTESLSVPTATSAREIPVKMLEENRRIINQHQSTVAGPKISFTHLIAWAMVRTLAEHPAMNARFLEADGEPHRQLRPSINLGLAIDVERKATRILLVPNIKDAERLDFPGFVRAYDDLVAAARQNKLAVEDFQDTTVTLTNPGMIGTALSVPRLMLGQGAIIGVGAIGYPAEYCGMAPEVISELGLSKVMTVTSTYDHRVIQGAESGAFLSALERLLQGDIGFYDRVFADLGAPYEPFRWSGDLNPQILGGSANTEAIAKQASVLQLIRSFRVRGHLLADLDPLGFAPEHHPELELHSYGLSVWDLDRKFLAGGLGGSNGPQVLRDILFTLAQTYCRHIGVEYMHIQEPQVRRWLQERIETGSHHCSLPPEDQRRILRKLNAAEAFEAFLGTNYVGQKRFSLEGAETLIPMLDALLCDAVSGGVEGVVMGMAHRGRLNVLSNIVGKPAGVIFSEFEGNDPETAHGSGDVKYHRGATGLYEAPAGGTLRVTVASNPSHLEAVNPVVEGAARALQDRAEDTNRERVLPVLIHGDAAFSGQGVVAETLNLSQLKGYRTGGTVHVVINNKIGFTTGPADARSSHYSTDVAKMLQSPVFHVNGDHPEEAVKVMRLALAFRQTFKRDVVVDLVCYRRWGHNEADDPSYTHPILYSKIQNHRSVRKLYTERLVRRGDFDVETAEQALEDFRERLQKVHDEVRQARDRPAGQAPAPPVDDEGDGPTVATAVPRETLETILTGLERTPDDFEVHPKLERQLERRREKFEKGSVDWGLAETLAFGSLVLDARPVRLSGEDSGRGTFSHRHAVLHDYRTAAPYVPLAHLSPDQAPFTVFDSLLSEFAVLGFEYGYSAVYSQALVMWEAQFGDFVNGAQVIIDQFIVSAESKWGVDSSLTLLLPHGYEGQGPEHSSARLERFLQLASRDNIRVANPSTPAQYFHLLRLQALDPLRKPLIVMTPKSLLRHRECVSTPEALATGGFSPVLDDPRIDSAEGVRRLVLCSGKVYYDLDAARSEEAVDDTAICRLERLYPFPEEPLAQLLARYSDATEFVWAQEEPRNMGAWSHLAERLRERLPDRSRLEFAGRPGSASPATGSHRKHVEQQERLVREALRR